MLKIIDNNTLEGVLPPSDCEKNLGVKWLTGTSTGSFYIGDKDIEKQVLRNFLNGKQKCYIDSMSYFNYLDNVEEILKKYKHMFYGPINVLENSKKHFESLVKSERYIYISYNYPDRYLKTSKYDKNVSEFKDSLAPNITKIKFIKNLNGEYKVYVSLVKNWRELIMAKAAKCDVESITTIFNDFVNDGLKEKKQLVDIARLFGIKYCSLIENNKIDINEVLLKSNYSSENLLDYIKNGMLLSKDIVWESQKNENNQFNVYGMHIQLKNSALDSNNPHVCIGWSNLGDLTNINAKNELKELYKKVRPEDSNQTVGANVSQIWMFKNEIKINDYIVYFDKGIAHFGKVIGNYEYIETPLNQDADYVNNRKVEWIKDIEYKDLPLEYRKSAMAQKSIFRLNTFKSLIEEIINGQDIDKETEENDVAEFNFSSSSIKDGYNLIVYGTPGCGKSYHVEHELLKGYSKENYIRTTFYPDYTNTDFVGQILPIVEGEKVTYKFNPGPFTLALERAIKNPNEKVALVIEELNRGSAASIFGDIFQLLDRKEGVSEYSITNVNIINYLNEQFKDEYTFSNIKLPGNLSIFATMNTSDQNVFTLDTAFKRRWKFKKLINEFKADHEFQNWYIPGADITWKELVIAINDYILAHSDSLNSEDKQLGVYFVDKNCMRKEKVDPTDPKALEEFSYKVMEYLWDDVAKFQRSKWFNNDIKSLDELIKEYADANIGLKVFNDDIFDK